MSEVSKLCGGERQAYVYIKDFFTRRSGMLYFGVRVHEVKSIMDAK